ncbi:hypothetical protein ON010_g14281 [Phytophthora cinnamomi]|nr:hypothetical protein ON010_g14281 [Phytophthora cinnamomi]
MDSDAMVHTAPDLGFPRPDEQRFSEVDDNVVEHGFPQNEQWLTSDEVQEHVVEHGLPYAVEHRSPRVIERELPDEVDAVVSREARPNADVVSRRRHSAAMIERGLLQAASEDTRRHGRREPRRPSARSAFSIETEYEVISVLVEGDAETPPRLRNVEVARPPRDVAKISRLSGLS